MKLTYYQLEPHLQKPPGCIYVVGGDEILLKQDAIGLIRNAAKRVGFIERIPFSPDAASDWDQLYSLLNSPSLFAEKRLLELDFRDASPNKIASSILQDYCKHPSKDNLLLIDLPKVDVKIAKSAWFLALEKAGILVTIWPIPREQLPQWISQRAKKYHIQLHADAAQLLADYVEGNLLAAAQAIEKLVLLKTDAIIQVDTLESILTDESRFTVFDFTESLIAGNQARTLQILESLRQDRIEPVLILWAITRELRLMATLSQELGQGSSYDHLFQKHRIFSRRQTTVRQFLTKFGAEDCWQHLIKVAEVDRVIKGAAAGDIWDNLQLLCLRIL